MTTTNNFIILNGLKYSTSQGNWGAEYTRAAGVRKLWSGSVDVTFGPSTLNAWAGRVNAPVTAREAGWGTIVDMRALYLSRTSLPFIDHYGDTHSVVLVGRISEKSQTPDWEAAGNLWYIDVILVKNG